VVETSGGFQRDPVAKATQIVFCCFKFLHSFGTARMPTRLVRPAQSIAKTYFLMLGSHQCRVRCPNPAIKTVDEIRAGQLSYTAR
jgi:hypothetical protein